MHRFKLCESIRTRFLHGIAKRQGRTRTMQRKNAPGRQARRRWCTCQEKNQLAAELQSQARCWLMVQLPLQKILFFAAAVAAGACASEVNLQDASGSSSTAGDPVIDQDCFERCIAQGGAEKGCSARCTTPGPSGSGGSNSTSNATSSGAGQGGDEGVQQAMVERQCFQCLEENAAACPSEHTACENDLACSVLKKCPFECLDDENCIQQCKAIVPDGVPLVTKLIECMVCKGPPCQDACLGSIMHKAYCQ